MKQLAHAALLLSSPNAGPSGDAFSRYVANCLERINFSRPARVLDIPCGLGRNGLWLCQKGHDVVCADIDEDRVQTVSVSAPQQAAVSIHCIVADAEQELPFADASFDLVTVVHYASATFPHNIDRVLRPDGYLIYETFGLQGKNWLSLPRPGEMRQRLASRFALINYKERASLTQRHDAVAVKLLARKL